MILKSDIDKFLSMSVEEAYATVHFQFLKKFGTIIEYNKNEKKLYYQENKSGLCFLFPDTIKEESQIEDLMKKSLQENKDYVYEFAKANGVKLNEEEVKALEEDVNEIDIYWKFNERFGWISYLEPSCRLFYERNVDNRSFLFPKYIKKKEDIKDLIEKSLAEDKDYVYEFLKGNQLIPEPDVLY